MRHPTARNIAIAGIAASLLLSACSAIPPQSVADPLGLHGQQVQVAFPAALSALAVTGEGAGTFVFDDDEAIAKLPLRPGLLTNRVRLADTVRLSGPEGIDTITITDPVLTVRLWQGAETFEEAEDGAKAEVSLTTTATIVYGDPSCFATVCDFKLKSGPRTLGDVSLSGTALSTVLDILGEEPSPNHGSASLTLQADPDELAGRTLRFTLEAAEGELRF